MKPKKDYGLSPFEKGIDFFMYFSGKQFTLSDIASRYDCSYRNAQNLKEKADYIANIVPCGFRESSSDNARCEQRLWRFQCLNQ